MVLCWKMDRLARNHFDTGQVLQALADGKLTRVVTPERDYTVDGNDRFLGSFELSIATKYIDDLRTNVRRGNRARLQLGWANFRPPIGYLEDRSGPMTIVIKDPERFALVRQLWDDLLSGRGNPHQIARWAAQRGLRTRKTARLGGKSLSFQQVYRLFANPFYMGLIPLTSGEQPRGAHQPMVTLEEFEKAQAILKRPTRTRRFRHVFAYAGLMKCGTCGHTLVPEVHTKRSGKRYVYYRCRSRVGGRPCSTPCLPEAALEQQLQMDLDRIRISPKAAAWIADQLRPKLESMLQSRQSSRRAHEQELADAGRELDRLITLRLRDQIDDADFERRRRELLEKQSRLRVQVEQPTESQEQLHARIQSVLEFGKSLPSAFKEGDAVRRRAIFMATCANPVVTGRKALYLAKKPWSFLEGSGRIRNWWAG